ncbi:MAG: hypothetical protein HUJ70_04900 [Pseudobutyrivibrio sp.]|nr:hypothetical protein [Pseudobutyrivibrio sp.]
MARTRHKLTADDLIAISKNNVKRFVRYDEGRIFYSMGRNRFIELARDANARYMVRGVVLCDTKAINEFILENCKVEDE